MTHGRKILVCRESGTDCDWEVRDSDEREVVAAAREHARRRHARELSVETIQLLLRDATPRGVGGI